MKLKNIRKIYHNKHNDVEALKGINLEFNEKGLIVLLGSSGCGKTTLLNIMSGNDTDFEGTISDVPQIEYLTQDFCLFESMSVLDNLLLVQDDLNLVQEYLTKFGLEEHQNKRVKLCSNGQKKRVQFIRALLCQPGMLLCDEPTAALDHENAEILMQYLKDISKEIQVILVTHDIALAERYADRIVQLSEGEVYSDTVHQSYGIAEIGHSFTKKTNQDTKTLVMKEIKSRIHEFLLFVTLSCLSIFAIFSTFNLYHTINDQTDYVSSFYNNSNLVQSNLKDSSIKLEELHFYDGSLGIHKYRDFDVYRYQDIKKIIDNRSDILAVEAFFDETFYQFSKEVFYNFCLGVYDEVFKHFTYKHFSGFEYNEINRPLQKAFYLSDNMKSGITECEKKKKKAENGFAFCDFYNIEEWNIDNEISMFDWVSDQEIPLMYGEMPTKNNEVVLAIDTAEMILQLNENYNSIEELMGQTITFAVQSLKNNPCEINSINATPNVHSVEEFDVEVKGISSIKNRSMNLVFFNNDFAHNVVTESFVNNYEKLYFHYVRLFVDPDRDVNEVVTYLNENIPQDKSQFSSSEGVDAVTGVVYYRNPKNFMLFSITISVVFGLILLIVYIFIQKRFKKEQGILSHYGYSSRKERIFRIGIINFMAFVVICVTGPFICNWINTIAVSMKYAAFIEYNPIYIFVSTLLIACLYFIYERMIGGKTHD